MKYWGENVFTGIPVGSDEPSLFNQFLDAHDIRPRSEDRRKLCQPSSTNLSGPLRLAGAIRFCPPQRQTLQQCRLADAGGAADTLTN